MLIKRIAFPFDPEQNVQRKLDYVKKIVGIDNVVETYDEYAIVREILVRCTVSDWEDIKFKLDLEKVYY